MNYFRNLEEYKAYMSGKAEKYTPVEYKEPEKTEEPTEEPKKPKRSRKKKGDE